MTFQPPSVRLSEERRRALERLLEKKGLGRASAQRISREPSDGPCLSSHAQQRIWDISQLPGAAPAFLTSNAIRLHGSLDRARLQAALDRIVERHEVLRTTYAEVAGTLFQRIADQGQFVLPLIELSGHPRAEQERLVSEHALLESTQACDLSAGPVIRGRLLRLGDEEHVLFLTAHRIIYDGWSRGAFIQEIGALYSAYVEGRADPLPPLEVQYADYARWQRGKTSEPASRSALEFWAHRLTGAPELSTLPCDRTRPAERSFAGSALRFVLDAGLGGSLKTLARRNQATLFMVMLAGWAVLMRRLSGQSDVVIGGLVANRQYRELEPLIGAFVNYLPLRVRTGAGKGVTGLELIAEVKETVLEAYARQWVPVGSIVERVAASPGSSFSPVFQVTLMLDNVPDTAFAMQGIDLGVEDTPVVASEFDISLSLKERGDEIDGHLVYASDLFTRPSIERWIEAYRGVLRDLVANPARSVAN